MPAPDACPGDCGELDARSGLHVCMAYRRALQETDDGGHVRLPECVAAERLDGKAAPV